MAPGASITCTGTYSVTQTDLDHGGIANTATATGTTPTGTPITGSGSSTPVTTSASPSVTLVKTATVTPAADQADVKVGDTVTYTFVVKNTGNVTLTTLTVNDPSDGGTVTCAPPAGGLAPNASVTCTGTTTHTITQADVDASSYSDTATATGTDNNGDTSPAAPSTATVNATAAPAATLLKTATVSPAADQTNVKVGDTVTYSFVVKNTGNVTLTTLNVTDPSDGGAVTCALPAGGLAPTASLACSGTTTHTITQADVDAGSYSDTATATGADAHGAPFAGAPSTAIVNATASPGLTVAKTPSTTTISSVGQPVTYTIVATNSGNVTLSGVSVTDTLTAPAAPALALSCTPTSPVASLAPGAKITCTGTYSVTQADLDHGGIANTATATGTGPGGAPVTGSGSSAPVTTAASPSVSLVKSGVVSDVNADHRTDVGDTIEWHFAVTNTGNLTLATPTIADPSGGSVTCPVTTLAPGASMDCTSDSPHTVTQADLDAGQVTDTATATAATTCTLPMGTLARTAAAQAASATCPTVTSPVSTATVPTGSIQSLSLHKTGTVHDTNNDGVTDTGDTIAWTIAITNTGNTTITGVTVTDPTAGVVSCPSSTLAPGATTMCTAPSHVITSSDATAGHVTNTATAMAIVNGVTLTATDTAQVDVHQTLAFTGIAALPVLVGFAVGFLILGLLLMFFAATRRPDRR